MTYMTMAIDEAKLPEAKALVEEFTNKMSILLESGKKTRVYEFGTYLYPLQKNQETI
jgi:nucleoid DNA-binding protein